MKKQPDDGKEQEVLAFWRHMVRCVGDGFRESSAAMRRKKTVRARRPWIWRIICWIFGRKPRPTVKCEMCSKPATTMFGLAATRGTPASAVMVCGDHLNSLLDDQARMKCDWPTLVLLPISDPAATRWHDEVNHEDTPRPPQ